MRLKAPLSGDTLIADQVKGDVRFQNKDLDDLILLRSDGAPTYNLAVVVDAHLDAIHGAGILDNASGSVSILELALNLAHTPTRNRLPGSTLPTSPPRSSTCIFRGGWGRPLPKSCCAVSRRCGSSS